MSMDDRYDYRLSAIRLRNFMAFEETDWIELRPITLLFGRNSSGKSAIIRALLLLKQSIEARDPKAPLIFNGRWVDLGSYYNAVHRHEVNRDITFGFRLARPQFEDPPQLGDGEAYEDFQNRLQEYSLSLEKYRNSENISGRWESPGLSIDIDDDRVDLELTLGRLANAHMLGLKRIAIYGWRSPELGTRVPVLVFALSLQEGGSWKPESELPLNYESGGVHYVQFSQKTDYGTDPVFEPDMSSGPIPRQLRPRPANELADWQVADSAIQVFFQHVSGLLEGIVYLPPLREEPRRYYRADHEWVRALMDPHGGVRQTVNQWFQRASLNANLRIMLLDEREGVVAVYLGEGTEDAVFQTNLRDVGSGVNQAVPVIVKSLQAKSKSLVIIEQPELHLHPEAQQTLAAMFIECIRAGAYLLVETHSEHIFFHLRRLLALPREMDANRSRSSARVDDFLLLFVNRADGKSTIRGVALDPDGKLIGAPPELRYFFGYNEEMRRRLDEDHRNRLKRGLHERFTGEELASLCYEMGINKEDALVGDTLRSKVEQLVLYCERRGDIPRLFKMCMDLRKDYDW